MTTSFDRTVKRPFCSFVQRSSFVTEEHTPTFEVHVRVTGCGSCPFGTIRGRPGVQWTPRAADGTTVFCCEHPDRKRVTNIAPPPEGLPHGCPLRHRACVVRIEGKL